ncbi:type I toxin-antitoxin system Fst family toxin [Vagococcus carniphilus]|uniref:Type I toxin-antitoxin system Fst family toxin n=1 Tax=Vagococcus carniphilus TaxID=218144 RepID=A0AAW8U3L6_9ENTE|nr:type I toxin-antitoxin system Fst family toxin [Vagococcus carniphilus]MDT2814859.1 type I toxin-antitoxin system Fst family toxin [Vagococcus carniphilus]MDT2831802.1 type I toxin-antitoxin system Fst family toxin [Vagococcus carniphilus]MDT2834118.1 type I toxin-antitoxin system Fst family toxin [Vagococcus carniphilus]MDT2840655.1 type I toxin-antitoxin system Fst family toxin [Vagococcus carniphilus]MDT2848922.1 type I toxin-antitoxin system Fst family toxin [Vagococcus carniphilus]
MITNFLCSLLVGILITFFDYWLNNRDKK